MDYRFARRKLLQQYRAGAVARVDICDAQAELMRIAINCSQRSTVSCPVCAEPTLRILRFVFGPRLPPGGRPVNTRAELRKLAAAHAGRRCYSVEVCTSCRWNHLLQIEPLGESA